MSPPQRAWKIHETLHPALSPRIQGQAQAVRKTLLCHLSWAHSLGAVTSSLDHSVPLTLGAPAHRMHDLELAWGRSPWILHLDSINEIKNSSESIVCKNSLQTIQSLSTVWIFVTPWITAHKASLSITNCQSLPKLMSIKSVMPSNHFILCRPLLLPPSIFPTIRVFSNESVLHIRWPKYSSFRNFSEPRGLHLPRHRKVLNSLTWDIWFSLINNNLLMVWLPGLCYRNTYVSRLPLLASSESAISQCSLRWWVLGLSLQFFPQNKT